MRIKLFRLNLNRMIIRFYIFMAFIIAGGFADLPWKWLILIGILIFISGLLGVSFKDQDNDKGKEQTKASNSEKKKNNPKDTIKEPVQEFH